MGFVSWLALLSGAALKTSKKQLEDGVISPGFHIDAYAATQAEAVAIDRQAGKVALLCVKRPVHSPGVFRRRQIASWAFPIADMVRIIPSSSDIGKVTSYALEILDASMPERRMTVQLHDHYGDLQAVMEEVMSLMPDKRSQVLD
jgi:hypothetical protein